MMKNLGTSNIDIAEEIFKSTQINILSSTLSPAANPAPREQEISESSSSFLNKSKKKNEEWHDKLSQSINSFMTTQAQNDKDFFKKLFGEKPSVESGDEDTIVIKVRNSGESFLTEIDLD